MKSDKRRETALIGIERTSDPQLARVTYHCGRRAGAWLHYPMKHIGELFPHIGTEARSTTEVSPISDIGNGISK